MVLSLFKSNSPKQVSRGTISTALLPASPTAPAAVPSRVLLPKVFNCLHNVKPKDKLSTFVL